MIRRLIIATIPFALAISAAPVSAQHRQHTASLDANGNLDALIASQASANGVPEDLVRRVIRRESGGNPRVVSAGNYGLMQIKLGTARAMGYQGDAAGLLDANTNMTYAVKYLAGAYRAAGGNADRAVHYYASGYYYAAKRKGMVDSNGNAAGAFADANGMTGFNNTSARNKVPQAAAHGAGMASSSNPYTGKPDYY